MSQDEQDTQTNHQPENHESISLVVSNIPIPDIASWEHVVVALSPRKQEQIMNGMGRLHSEECRVSTWLVVRDALSTALFSDPAGLYVQSSMELHRKDFLLFTRTNASRKDGTGGVLEVDFSNKLQGATWQGHWQEARPALACFVRDCESQQNAMSLRHVLNWRQHCLDYQKQKNKRSNNVRKCWHISMDWEAFYQSQEGQSTTV